MNRLVVIALALLCMSCAATQSRPEINLSYEEATSLWETNKDRPEFQEYLEAFTQWNNQLELDTRNGCFPKGDEQVTILLVVTDRAVIEPVFSSIGGAKAECFRMTYLGLEVAKPPFSPLVLQLNMQ